jgi:hypothetical protein
MHKSLLMHCKISCWLVSVRLRNSIVDIQLWDELQVTCDGDTTGRISWYSVYRLKGVSKRILAQDSNDFGFAPFSIRRIGENRSMDLGLDKRWMTSRYWLSRTLISQPFTSTAYLIGRELVLRGHRIWQQETKSTGINNTNLYEERKANNRVS